MAVAKKLDLLTSANQADTRRTHVDTAQQEEAGRLIIKVARLL